MTALRTVVQSKPSVLALPCETIEVPSKLMTLATDAFEPTELSRISIALIWGLAATCTKSMLTVPSLVMSNDFMVPLLRPGSTLGS